MIVAIITDEMFDEPYVIVGQSMQMVNRAIVAYLRATQPVQAFTGNRLVVPDEIADYKVFLAENLPDIEDIGVEVFAADTSPAFVSWCHSNVDALYRSHNPRVQTIEVGGGLL